MFLILDGAASCVDCFITLGRKMCNDSEDQHCDLYARGLRFKPCRKLVIQTNAFHDFAQSFWANSLSVRNLSY